MKIEWCKPILEYLGSALTDGSIATSRYTGDVQFCSEGMGAAHGCSIGNGGNDCSVGNGWNI